MTESFLDRLMKVSEIYTPSYPVEIKDLFSGRTQQFGRAINIISQKGQHAIIFGDRGVGKTSFSNVLKVVLETPERQVYKYSCNSEDTFTSVWKNIFSGFTVQIEQVKERVSFVKDTEVVQENHTNFVFHLGKFCLGERGEILRVAGAKNRQRYKFKNPLMRAFIKLKAENDRLKSGE